MSEEDTEARALELELELLASDYTWTSATRRASRVVSACAAGGANSTRDGMAMPCPARV